MIMKNIVDSNGKTFKLGRVRPAQFNIHPKMSELLSAQVLPNVAVPASTHYSDKAAPALHQMYGNDTLGDCVIAGGFHVRGVSSYNAGAGVVFSMKEVIADYSAIGGYDPSQTQPDGSNPTDQGCDENVALSYWKKTGFPDGVKLAGAVSVDATNEAEIKLALYLFENVYFGVELPDAWVNPMPSKSGFKWDVAGDADPENGHCFVGVDYVAGGVKIDTWGMTGYVTWAAAAKYAVSKSGGQLFTLLTPDIIAKASAKSPAGFDIATLEQYLKQI
jgi:hypothetical protein